MTPRRATTATLAVLGAAGGPVFTLAWLALGAATAEHDQRADTISALAAVGAPTAAPMLLAFAVQGLGQLALALVARRLRLRLLGAALLVAGTGTLAAGLLRLPEDGTSAVATLHALAAVAAFGGLHAAAGAGLSAAGLPRGLRLAAAAALVVAVPHTVWFGLQLPHPGPWFGYAEKAFTTVLLAWTTAFALSARRARGWGGPG